MRKRLYFLIAFGVFYLSTKSQDSTTIAFYGYGEVYYVHDFSKPNNHTKPPFIYSHNRTGEVNVNLGLFKASFTNQKARGNLGVMAGTYSNANLSSEPGVLKNLYEANAGVRVNKYRELWIDAGILPSHIGFESAIGKDHWTLTRSLAADNSPYYEAGVRLSYTTPNKKWYVAFLLLNGWQRIQRLDGNHTPAIGTQVTYKPNNTFLMNSSTFIGSDQPDSARKMRYFHNLYSVIQLSRKIALTAGLDVGLQQKNKCGSSLNLWYTPVIILRMKLTDDKFVNLRTEYYDDKAGVIISPINSSTVRLGSYSSNFDWNVNQNVMWRLEVKWMKCDNAVFLHHDGMYQKTNWSFSTAICFSF